MIMKSTAAPPSVRFRIKKIKWLTIQWTNTFGPKILKYIIKSSCIQKKAISYQAPIFRWYKNKNIWVEVKQLPYSLNGTFFSNMAWYILVSLLGYLAPALALCHIPINYLVYITSTFSFIRGNCYWTWNNAKPEVDQ